MERYIVTVKTNDSVNDCRFENLNDAMDFVDAHRTQGEVTLECTTVVGKWVDGQREV